MFDFDEMNRELGRMPQRAEKALVAYGKTIAADLQREAQEERPWTDRTAHARQRMKGYCKVTDTGIRIYLAHGVNYGVQLEFGHEDAVQGCMNGLYPHVKLVDDQQPHYLDDDVEAYTAGLYYQSPRVSKVNRL